LLWVSILNRVEQPVRVADRAVRLASHGWTRDVLGVTIDSVYLETQVTNHADKRLEIVGGTAGGKVGVRDHGSLPTGAPWRRRKSMYPESAHNTGDQSTRRHVAT
jgi:hypothetical protein